MDGLTLDVDDDLLYWTDVTYQNIQRADLDGGNRRTILKGLDKPRAIVLYKARRFVKSLVLLERNRPFLNYLRPLLRSESWCSSFHMQINFHSHEDEFNLRVNEK